MSKVAARRFRNPGGALRLHESVKGAAGCYCNYNEWKLPEDAGAKQSQQAVAISLPHFFGARANRAYDWFY